MMPRRSKAQGLALALVAVLPAAAMHAGGQTADEAAARIDALLRNARVSCAQRNYGAAVDALEEATRLAGGRPERGQPGGPHSERVLGGVADLRSLLAREGDTLSQKVEATKKELADHDWAVWRLGVLEDGTKSNWDGRDAASRFEGQIDTAHKTLANEGTLMPPGSGEPQAIVAAIRSSADSVCASTDAARARTAWNEIDRQNRIVDSAAAAAETWWARRRGDETFALSVLRMSGLVRVIEYFRQALGENDSELRAALNKHLATIDLALQAHRLALARVQSVRADVDILSKAYVRAGALGPFGENQAVAWERQCEQTANDINADINSVERLRTNLDALASRQNDPALADLRLRLAQHQTRLESLERALLERDKLASWILTAREYVQKEMGRADACLQAVTARQTAPSQPQPTPQDRRAPAQPDQPAVSGAGAAGGQPPPSAPVPATTTQSRPSATTPPPQPQRPPADVPVSPPAGDPNTAGGLRIQGGSTRITVGQRVQFVATDYGNRPYANVTWNSLREDLLTLDAQGWATGLRPGAVTIQAKHGDDALATIDVEVVAEGGGFVDLGGANTPPAAAADPANDSRAVTAPAGGFVDLGGQAQSAGPQRRQAAAGQAPPASTTGSAPVGQAGRLTAIAPGQPAAWHIFAAGSRLGWAGGLGQYSVGPADESIIEHLQVAGEHVMWANRESYAPTLAWTDWANTRATYRTWAERLQRNPANDVRRQIAVATAGQISGLAQALGYQTVGTTEARANCDAFYVRLGFSLGYGSQVMAIADEAVRRGDRRASVAPRQDALSHLQAASSLLSDYESVVVASGRCADLRDVRTLLHQLFALNANDVSAQAATATAAWELANERIAALGGAGTAGGARRTQPAPPPTPSRPVPSSAPVASAPAGGSPVEALLADPGELEGYWAGWAYGGQTAVFRFTRQGDEYLGIYEDAPDKDFGNSDGEVVFRGRRVAANAYEGTLRVRRVPRPDAQRLTYERGDITERVTIAVAGAYFWLRGPGRTYSGGNAVSFMAEQFCARILGPRPWMMPEGAPLDLQRTNYSAGALGVPVWFLARGRAANGQDVVILYPDLDVTTRGGAVPDRRIQQGAFRYGSQLNKDPLSARWLQNGFVPVEGPLTAMQAAARLANFPR